MVSMPNSHEPSAWINQWGAANRPHHLVQANPVPGAAEEVCGQGVADQHVSLHGAWALRQQGDQRCRHQGLQLHTGVRGVEVPQQRPLP